VKRGIPVLSRPPYSPDLDLVDYFLFPKSKIAMKRTRFEAASLIQETLMREIKVIQEEAFSRALNPLSEQRKCTEVDGDYIE
jgi:hypothetical protein